MPWPSLSPPTAGTVITVAWESAQVNDPLLWLRLMTGNADPPGNDYVVVSQGTSSTAWGKVTAGVLAPGAVVGHLGYTPLNRAGDTTLFDLTVSRQSSGTPTDGILLLGQTGGAVYLGKVGSQIVLQGAPVQVGSALSVLGALAVTGDATVYRPASPATGFIIFGNNPARYIGLDATGTFVIDGQKIWHAGNDGPTSGLSAQFAADADTVDGQHAAAFALSGHTHPAGSGDATTLDGHDSSTTPAAGAIPVADAGGKLDPGWLPAVAGGSDVPAGLIALWGSGSPPTGWVINTTLQGRFVVGAGGALGVGLGGTGGTASHAHTVDTAHSHTSAALDISGAIGAASGTPFEGNVTTPGSKAAVDTHGHAHTLDVSGSTDAAGSSTSASTTANHIPPYIGMHYIQKS